MALVGTPHDRGNTLQVDGVDGPGAAAPTIELDDVQRFNEFSLQSSGGVMDVLASLDGVTFSTALGLQDKQSLTPTVHVAATAAGLIYYFSGVYKALRIRQVGAGAVTAAKLICAKKGRD